MLTGSSFIYLSSTRSTPSRDISGRSTIPNRPSFRLQSELVCTYVGPWKFAGSLEARRNRQPGFQSIDATSFLVSEAMSDVHTVVNR